MKIKTRLSQYRRDFTAIFECEFCGATKQETGYDDAYFHQQVIPSWPCPECGKASEVQTSSPIVPEGLVL